MVLQTCHNIDIMAEENNTMFVRKPYYSVFCKNE